MLDVRATAETPLFIGAAPEAGNVVRGQPFIPGSVLRGALAAEWIRRHGPPSAGDADFMAAFDGQVRFLPMLPWNPDWRDESAAVGNPAGQHGLAHNLLGRETQLLRQLEPVSVLRCKYGQKPGDGCYDEVVDLLWEFDPWRGESKEPRTECRRCGGPLEAGKGLMRGGVEKTTYTRVELTRHETAKQGQLFSRQAIPVGTQLVGGIVNPTARLEELVGLDGGIDLWFGGRRTVGGFAHVAFEQADDRKPSLRQDGRLALTLRSPAVFVDSFTRPCLGFPREEIARLFGLKAGLVPDHVRQWVRVERVSGWHAASGLPKPEDLALAPGSSLLIKLPGEVAPDLLADLARTGLGLRRSEGMGLVDVNPEPWRPPAFERREEERRRRTEVDELLARLPGGDVDGRRRLLDWICGELREQAERAEVKRPWTINEVLDQRRELRYAGSDLRNTVARLFETDPTPKGLRSAADELEGARP